MAFAVDEQASCVTERLVVVDNQEVHSENLVRGGGAGQAEGEGGAIAESAFAS